MARCHPNTSLSRSGTMLSTYSRPLRPSPALLQLRPTRAAKQLGRCLANVNDARNGSPSSTTSSEANRAGRGDQVVFFTSTELKDPAKIEAAYQFIGIPKGVGSLGLPDLEVPIEDLRMPRSSASKSKSAVATKQARAAEVAAAKQRAADIIAAAEQRAAEILATAVTEANVIKAEVASAAAVLAAAGEELAGLNLSIAERKQYLQKLEQKAAEIEAANKAAKKAVKPGTAISETSRQLSAAEIAARIAALRSLSRPQLEEFCDKNKVDMRYKELPVEPLRELVARFAGLSSHTYPLFIDDMTWDQVNWHNTSLVGLQKYCSQQYIAYSRRSKGELLECVIEYKKRELVIKGPAKGPYRLYG